MPVTEGKKAPALTLRDSTEHKVSLADDAGQNVAPYF